MHRLNSLVTSFLFIATLVACSDSPSVTEDSVADDHPQDGKVALQGGAAINWFNGSVDEAFAFARKEAKPLFFYWGAIWCPPCQEIKNTVFKSNQFVSLSNLFVPVYLDGDTERAQAYGEKFGVKGYPTMIIFSPQAEEITRIPGGIDISRYNTVLQLSLQQMRPTSELIAQAIEDTKFLAATDYTQLAYYSWGQDFNSLPEDQGADLFLELSRAAGELASQNSALDESTVSQLREDSARLYLQYLASLADQESGSAGDEEEQEDRIAGVDAYERLSQIFSSPDLTLACWDYLAYYAEPMSKVITGTPENMDKLKKRWSSSLRKLKASPSLSTAEQLAGWLPLLEFHFANESSESLSEEILAEIRKDTTEADRKTTNSFTRQSVISQINYLYQTAHLYSDAEALLLSELNKSRAPYYFMSSLAALAEKNEEVDAALTWRRKAYETSIGSATRFQWGANYVRSLVRMAPESSESIVSTSLKLFDDLQSEKDVFVGRNFRVLRSLTQVLNTWAEEQDASALLRAMASKVEAMCVIEPVNTPEKTNCEKIVELSSNSSS